MIETLLDTLLISGCIIGLVILSILWKQGKELEKQLKQLRDDNQNQGIHKTTEHPSSQ